MSIKPAVPSRCQRNQMLKLHAIGMLNAIDNAYLQSYFVLSFFNLEFSNYSHQIRYKLFGIAFQEPTFKFGI